MHQIIETNKPATMSSVELVQLINESRLAQGKKTLRHDNFMTKIEKHPGINSPKFLGEYKDASGRMSKCYNLPKRESELMVMSESLDVQTKVYDRLAAIESSPSLPTVKNPALQMVIALAAETDRIEQEQKRQAAEVARLQETVAVIEARTQPESKHFTVLGYANLVGHNIDYKTASVLGRKCANLSREQGLPIGDVTDPRFGRVHSYHESVLKEVVGQFRRAA